MKPIKILCILNSLDRCNGISTYIMNYYNKTNHDNVKYDFLVTDDNVCDEYRENIESNGDKIILTNRVRLHNYFKEIKKIKNILKENNYSIVYSQILYTAFFYLKGAKSVGIKNRILHCHNTPTKDKNIIKEILYKIMSKLAVWYATDYFACSDLAGKYLFKNRNYKVVRNAIDVDKYLFDNNIRNKYRNELNLNNKFVIGHVGRLDTQKNHKFILDVFYELLKKEENAKLLLVGSGPLEEEIRQYSKQKNIDKYIEFLGTRNDINNILQAMDVFVFPSLFEGLGIAAVEAQMSSLPCIVSDKVPLEVKFSEKVKFIGIQEKNIDDWCEAIIEFKNTTRSRDEELCRKSGYDINNEVEKLEKLYKEIVETGE